MSAVHCLIDTDMAIDNWMATLYLLKCRVVDVQAITIAATGEAHARPGMMTALRLCELANSGNIDVTHGRTTPLRGNHAFPLLVRLIMDRRFLLSLPGTRRRPVHEPAVTLLKRHLNA